ncbi:MAG TPA: lipoyl(octanoyl) transferase LipB [Myxococcota bacterium]|nr:lipoyl(octanoyl) transferase LipB [Myxococcota bacterium]
MNRLDWVFLGKQPYRQALEIQYRHARRVAAGAAPVLFLMEHPPTVTLGRQAELSNLGLPRSEYGRRGIGVFDTLRGGDVTFHGPGQLVGYPVGSLDAFGCSVPAWVRGHAAAIIEFLSRWGIGAEWSDTHPGVWVGREKIAAFGFHISRRISTHGFALNIDTDLSFYRTIISCGLRHLGVTSMARRISNAPTVEEAAREIAGLVAESFGWQPGRRLAVGRFPARPLMLPQAACNRPAGGA